MANHAPQILRSRISLDKPTQCRSHKRSADRGGEKENSAAARTLQGGNGAGDARYSTTPQ